MKLWRYIQGFRKGKDAHRLEKEAMNDPFLAHALRGYDRVSGDHIRQLQQLQKEVHRKTARPSVYLRAAGIAASVLLVVGIGSYWLIQESSFTNEMELAVFHELKPDTTVPVPPSLPVVQEEIAQARVYKKEKKEKKIEEKVAAPIVAETSPIVAEESEASTELDEVVVVGYGTQKKQAFTGAVAAVSAPPSTIIKGKVTDKTGEPIIGANVMIDGTSKGTLTDMDGHFELQANDGSKIKVSYIGYENMDILADTSKVMQIAMHEDERTLDEVVVVGYGTQKKAKPEEPKPVDGKKAYNKYIKENLVRPDDDACRDIKGKVILRFRVDAQGRPTQIVVEQSLCPSADQEAIRLLTEGPDWIQGSGSTTLEVKF